MRAEAYFRHGVPAICFALIAILPVVLAIDRLVVVGGVQAIPAIGVIEDHGVSSGALWFSTWMALSSVALTLVIGLPIAWHLGRWRWNRIKLLRVVLTSPFVIPSIVAAAGFLAISETWFDLRSTSERRLICLLLAHAWFNISLFIRFVEPRIATLDTRLEEQLSILPAGRTLLGRIRFLWWPILRPSIICAATLTFVFSFTSFALVRWLLVGDGETIESSLASLAPLAGIPGYMETFNVVVLGLASVQMIILGLALALLIFMQRRLEIQGLVSEDEYSTERPPLRAKVIIYSAILFTVIPILHVIWYSFIAREGLSDSFSLEGWKQVIAATGVNASLWDALANSLIYGIITLIISIPLGLMLAESIVELERKGKGVFSRTIDLLTLIPLAVSPVIIGLGVLIGLVKLEPSLLKSWWLPIIPHVMVTIPFVCRILIQARRNLSPAYDEAGAVLGISPMTGFRRITLPLMRPSLIVAAGFGMAISLGEFGASWLVMRSGSWTTLPILIDDHLARTGQDPHRRAAAMAAATVLTLLILVVFSIIEKFRRSAEESGF